MGFGERIRMIRKPLKQDAFAVKVGLHQNTVGRWEREQRTPDLEDLNKILAAYPDISPAWLLTGEGEMKRGEEENRSATDDIDINEELFLLISEAVLSEAYSTGKRADDIDRGIAKEISSTIIGLYRLCIIKNLHKVDNSVVLNFIEFTLSMSAQLSKIHKHKTEVVAQHLKDYIDNKLDDITNESK